MDFKALEQTAQAMVAGSRGILAADESNATIEKRFKGPGIQCTEESRRGYREYRGLGWLIVVRQPADLALAPARELQRSLFAWGVLLTVALVTVSWISAGRLSRRLRSMGLAAGRIRGGDVLTVLPRPPGDGEVARMCGAVGDLVEELRAKARDRDASGK